MVIAKGRVLAVKENKAIVSVENRKETVGIIPELDIRAGDMVIIAFNMIVGRA